MRALADGKLEGDIPVSAAATRSARWRRRFRSSRIMRSGSRLEKVEAEAQRAPAERRAAMESLASDFERSVNGIVRSVSTQPRACRPRAVLTATASDRSARAATVARHRKAPPQCRHGRGGSRGAVELGRRKSPAR